MTLKESAVISLRGSESAILPKDSASQIETVKILHAEDDELLRRLSNLALTRRGFCVDSFEDGLRAWEALEAGRYDLIVTDNHMPHMTGLELAARARLKGLRLPIIMASGSAAPFDHSERWLNLAARLQKPFTPELLIEAVQRALGRSENVPVSLQPSRSVVAPSRRFDDSPPHWGINE